MTEARKAPEVKTANARKAFEAAPEIFVTNSQSNYEKGSEIKFNVSRLNDTNFKKILLYYDSICSSPTEYLLTSVLAALSGAIGKTVYFPITSTMKIHLNIWAVIIGKSTICRKTTALNQAKEDLQRIETKNYNEYKEQFEIYQREISGNKNNKTEKTVAPPKRKYYLLPNDSTIESLSEILAGSDRGLLCHSEFGQLLAQLNRGYSGDSKQFLTTIYDIPESYEVSRTTKQGAYLIKPYMSILGASTIEWIKENSSETDLRSGFFARYLFSIRNFPDKEYIPLLKLSKISKQSDHYIDTRGIYEYLVNITNDIELTVSEEAESLFNSYDENGYYNEILQAENEDERSFRGRLIIYTLKFAGVIAVTDKRTEITLADMQDAIHITEYYKKNVELLLNRELNSNELLRNEEKVISVIKNRGGKITRSNLLNSLRGWDSGKLNIVITNLIQKELIETVSLKENNSKRPVSYYQLKAGKN